MSKTYIQYHIYDCSIEYKSKNQYPEEEEVLDAVNYARDRDKITREYNRQSSDAQAVILDVDQNYSVSSIWGNKEWIHTVDWQEWQVEEYTKHDGEYILEYVLETNNQCGL